MRFEWQLEMAGFRCAKNRLCNGEESRKQQARMDEEGGRERAKVRGVEAHEQEREAMYASRARCEEDLRAALLSLRHEFVRDILIPR